MKIIMCPLVVILASYLFPNVNYSALSQPIVVGLVLALAGTMMEYLFLREGTLWMNTGMDFVASSVIVYFMTLFFIGARVTVLGAILTGLLLAITEHFTHVYLIQSSKTRKIPT